MGDYADFAADELRARDEPLEKWGDTSRPILRERAKRRTAHFRSREIASGLCLTRMRLLETYSLGSSTEAML